MTADVSMHTVRNFREVLLWPVQLMPLAEGASTQPHWKLLEQGWDPAGKGNPAIVPGSDKQGSDR